jgi:ribosomal protein L7/L12
MNVRGVTNGRHAVNWKTFVLALTEEERLTLSTELRATREVQALTSEEQTLIIRGRNIDAIKSVKNRLCCSLVEARNMVNGFRP